jgi:hypothetical protein
VPDSKKKKKMKIYLQSFDFLDQFQLCAPLAAVLLSATCVGNDGKRCPLFHGSLAPELFSRTDPHMRVLGVPPPMKSLMILLLHSNNITWAHTMSLSPYGEITIDIDREIKNVINTLIETRYSSRSIKRVYIHLSATLTAPLLTFIENHCIALESLRLRCDVSVDFRFLSKRASTLVHLHLTVVDEGSVLTVPFEQLSHLRSLEIDCPYRSLFAQIAKCPALEVLIIASPLNDRLLENDFRELKKLTNLRELSVEYLSNVSMECINETLSSFEFLRKLNIPTVNADTFRLFICPLEDLRFRHHDVDDEMMENMCEIQTLKTLALAVSSKITVTGWKRLTKLPLLQSLTLLGNQQLTREALEVICSISSLRILKFTGNAFEDFWFEPISKLENLEVLDCGGMFFAATRITGSGLHHLYKLKSLRKLVMRPSPNLRPDMFADLMKRMQSLTLTFVFDSGSHTKIQKYIQEQEEAKAGTRRERE